MDVQTNCLIEREERRAAVIDVPAFLVTELMAARTSARDEQRQLERVFETYVASSSLTRVPVAQRAGVGALAPPGRFGSPR